MNAVPQMISGQGGAVIPSRLAQKCKVYGKMILKKITETATRAKMHQIRLRLGLRPRPRWGAYTPQPPSCI